MQRYAGFLRGVVVCDARTSSVQALEKKAQAAAGFDAFVRPIDELRKLLASDPYKGVRLAARILRFADGKEQTTRTWQTIGKVVSR